ncbi:PilC/PilY family type IV pilus protein [Larsenimonas suaedae]|uniref:PilC/PilY family type IV pilus protein n=1 Tax=Larsenimonas suaedae TaxID=1851019 RepID=A0ABU1GYN6_9GAMM|nr:PilC/PilY family type IV pilus protein [Larsenimonas suaedae]MCM2973708.1 PilC/PilY family type IV pilus protein [Larsenimonas suaedae]MDR5897158.1 PilC/PilY family type IV pilus protein [Larsenimonas suaedae]
MRVVIALLWALLMAQVAKADDTSIYLPEYVSGQPQVLIVFDNSGSMATVVPNSGGKTRMEIGKDVVQRLVANYPNINFGLSVFNNNAADVYCTDSWCSMSGRYAVENRHNGGRIVRALSPDNQQSASSRQALSNTINSLTPQTSTPLCETMYEVYRYFTGSAPVFGLDKASADTPNVDGNALTSTAAGVRYRSPLRMCENVYVVYVTDGFPQWDTRANAAIKAETGKSCGRYTTINPVNSDENVLAENCLPTLTRHLATTDLSPTLQGTQHAYTFTVGFTTEQKLLEDAATTPDGISKGYFTANDEDELTQAFTAIVTSILGLKPDQRGVVTVASADGFVNDSVVYQPLFQPKPSQRWTGNLKKFEYDTRSGSVDDSTEAWTPSLYDPSTAVESGGVGARLRDRFKRAEGHVYTPTARAIYTDRGSGNSGLQPLATLGQGALTLSSTVASKLRETFYSQQDVVDWLIGKDVTGENATKSTDNIRPWLMGDILHASPLAINYGCPGSKCISTVFAATNEGMVHAFDGDSGAERWAFWPSSMSDMAVYRMLNLPAAYLTPDGETFKQAGRYGLDGPMTRFTLPDGNGAFTTRLTVGMRRGGFSYYALDVSEPESPPTLAFHISPSQKAFSGLGQSWSSLTPTVMPAAEDSGPTRKVFVFGGGYDPNKDADGVGTDDARGRGVYIVDALSGALVAHLAASNLTDSVPSDILTVDSNGDGVTDRMFFGDTGGNVWMGDVSAREVNKWRLERIAALGRDRNGSASNDRRFFASPALWRTTLDGEAVDLLVLGSGNRARPQSRATENRLYLLNVTERLKGAGTTRVIGDGDLQVAMENIVNTGKTLGAGWKLLFDNPGEKVFSRGVLVADSLLFTSYAPSSAPNICTPASGSTQLHIVTLARKNGVFTVRAAQSKVGEFIQAPPEALVTEQATFLAGVDGEVVSELFKKVEASGRVTEQGGVLNQMVTFPAYWYRE